MNLIETQRVVKILTTETTRVPYLIGHGGIGKSESVYEVAMAEAKHYQEPVGISEQRVGQEETGDITGMPRAGADGVTHYTRNPLFPTNADIGQYREAVAIAYPDGHWEYGGLLPKRGIWFLDEVNRGDIPTIQALYQVLLTRTMHEHRLADNWQIVLAGNPPTNDYYVTNLDDSFLSRVVQIWVTNSIDQWALHARDMQASDDLIDFLRAQSHLLNGHTDTYQIVAKPSPRGWMMVDEILKTSLRHESPDLIREVLEGIVGVEAATAAMTFMDAQAKNKRPLNAGEVLTDYPAHRDRFQRIVNSQRSDLRDATVDDVLTTITERAAIDNAKPEYLGEWLKDLPLDVGFGALQRIIDSKLATDETSFVYQALMTDMGDEIYAYFESRKEEIDKYREQIKEAGMEDATLQMG